MNSLLKILGSIIFWLIWPMFYIQFRRSRRARVLIVSGNKVLFVKNLIYRNQLSLPGGGLKEDETPVKAAVRELREETGLKINPKDLRLLTPEKLISDIGIKYRMSSYYLELPKPLPVKPQTSEILTVQWLDWKNLLDTYHVSTLTNEILHAWIKNKDLLD